MAAKAKDETKIPENMMVDPTEAQIPDTADDSDTIVTPAPASDPWSDMVTINLPKAVNGEPNYVIASVNGRVFKVKRGVNVDVPAPIAEVIENSRKAQENADAYIESKESV